MKTKIIYISGNEIFDMADIRAAFDEVRVALNLDKNTVLFGVPVDADDAGFMNKNTESTEQIESVIPVADVKESVIESDTITESVVKPEQIAPEPVIEEPTKKRGRTKKTTIKLDSEEISDEPDVNIEQNTQKSPDDASEKIVPILSVLSTKDSSVQEDLPEPDDETLDEEPEIIEDVTNESVVQISDLPEPDTEEINDMDTEPDLEKLLSEMKPLEEDILDEDTDSKTTVADEPEEENIDATLEQLATEFVQTQDKIASASKSSSRSKIGKLRNILPFKQSKHYDQGLGDLFGWAGVAANDEEFSVPGFFTSASPKK